MVLKGEMGQSRGIGHISDVLVWLWLFPPAAHQPLRMRLLPPHRWVVFPLSMGLEMCFVCAWVLLWWGGIQVEGAAEAV